MCSCTHSSADSPFHEPARDTIAELAGSRAAWAIPWPCVHEFYAVVTNPKIFADPQLPARARAQLRAWLASPSLQLLTETHEHWVELDSLLEASHIVGPAVHDARVAVLCLTHGVTQLLTMDRDFSRFPALRTRSILA